MLDTHKQIVNALKDILPVYYELICDSTTPKPCITYCEQKNDAYIEGEQLGYSWVGYYIKIWDNDISRIQENAIKVDNAMRGIGYKRISSTELFIDDNIEKVMIFEGLGLERFD